MSNPYKNLPDDNFWRKGVFEKQNSIAPKMAKVIKLEDGEVVATAGSCFAQNVAKHLRDHPRLNFLESEQLRDDDPVYSARYGNIYTAAQLSQLVSDSLGGIAPGIDCAIRRTDGRFVDIYRPYIEPDGFATAEEVAAARQSHLEAVKRVFLEADVLVFTLGLTEAWRSGDSHRVFPVCPGVYSEQELDYEFHNYGLEEIQADMDSILTMLKDANGGLRVLLTVSPVPLTATFTQDHVLVATSHSKALLRVVCGQTVDRYEDVFYLPSYEMVANPFTASSAYSPSNLREVQSEEVQRVMEFFDEEYLANPLKRSARSENSEVGTPPEIEDSPADVLCDDVEIEKSMGF